mgnify:CR=1 FL=1
MTPGIFTVKSQTVMISLIRHFFPFHCHFLSYNSIFFSYIIQSEHPSHFTVSGYSHDSFHGKIGIMSPMSGEVIRAKLVFRVLSILY